MGDDKFAKARWFNDANIWVGCGESKNLIWKVYRCNGSSIEVEYCCGKNVIRIQIHLFCVVITVDTARFVAFTMSSNLVRLRQGDK